MGDMFAMQRANGDWFALDDHGAFRVPIFRSKSEAMKAKAFNVEMMVFSPIVLDEVALKDLARANGGGSSHFWLVDQSSTNLRRGRRIEHAQLAGFAGEPEGGYIDG